MLGGVHRFPAFLFVLLRDHTRDPSITLLLQVVSCSFHASLLDVAFDPAGIFESKCAHMALALVFASACCSKSEHGTFLVTQHSDIISDLGVYVCRGKY